MYIGVGCLTKEINIKYCSHFNAAKVMQLLNVQQ